MWYRQQPLLPIQLLLLPIQIPAAPET